MLRRLVFGLVIGMLVGGLLAAGLVKGLGMDHMTAVLAYLFAALTGALTGLVAGKPIWAQGGAIEAGLKAIFGALLAAGGMFAIRSWLGMHLDLSAIGAGAGSIGELPAASLPLLSGVLGALYGLDNTPATDADNAKKRSVADGSLAGKKGAAAAKTKKRVVVESPEEDDDADVAPPKKAQH